jgi:hypothetical protein
MGIEADIPLEPADIEVEDDIDAILGIVNDDPKDESVEAESDNHADDDDDSDTLAIEKTDKKLVPLQKHLKAKAKLKSKAEEAEERADRAEAELAQMRGLIAEQTTQTDDDLPPSIPTEAGCGYDTDEYVKQIADYNRKLAKWNQDSVRKVIQQSKMEDQRGVTQQEQESELGQAIEAHYERAEKLGIKRFDLLEERVINAIGLPAVKHITVLADNSERIIAYLASKPEELKRLQGYMQNNPQKSILMIGELKSLLSQRKQSNAPAPEPEVRGGAAASTSALERQLDAARKKAERTGDYTEVTQLRRKMKG